MSPTDPRTTESGGKTSTPPPPNSNPKEAPGGVGTGTKGDPANKPADHQKQ